MNKGVFVIKFIGACLGFSLMGFAFFVEGWRSMAMVGLGGVLTVLSAQFGKWLIDWRQEPPRQ